MAIHVETTSDAFQQGTGLRSPAPRRSMPPGAEQRACTHAAHVEAVERVIQAMHEGLEEPFSLDAMARIAFLSRFHFDRVFCAVTGISPCRFLAALRVEAAKRLLLTTHRRVTDICLDVGYHSLGSFTRDFTYHVGLSPNQFRRLAHRLAEPRWWELIVPVTSVEHDRSQDGIHGRITGLDSWHGLIFTGLFPTPIPHGRPVRCAILTFPGTFGLPDVPNGCYHALSVAFPWSDNPLDHLLPDPESLRVGAANGPLMVYAGRTNGQIQIEMRPVRLTDPPILVALPCLLEDHARLDGKVSA